MVAAPVDDDGNETGEIQGLAHLREWVRPLRGVKCGYLDDLFVDPEHRGSGVVDALYDAMRAIAVERGWPVIRWTTADDNYRARAVYDKLATRTTWITYDMATEGTRVTSGTTDIGCVSAARTASLWRTRRTAARHLNRSETPMTQIVHSVNHLQQSTPRHLLGGLGSHADRLDRVGHHLEVQTSATTAQTSPSASSSPAG